jgi:hypothetical protein
MWLIAAACSFSFVSSCFAPSRANVSIASIGVIMYSSDILSSAAAFSSSAARFAAFFACRNCQLAASRKAGRAASIATPTAHLLSEFPKVVRVLLFELGRPERSRLFSAMTNHLYFLPFLSSRLPLKIFISSRTEPTTTARMNIPIMTAPPTSIILIIKFIISRMSIFPPFLDT